MQFNWQIPIALFYFFSSVKKSQLSFRVIEDVYEEQSQTEIGNTYGFFLYYLFLWIKKIEKVEIDMFLSALIRKSTYIYNFAGITDTPIYWNAKNGYGNILIRYWHNPKLIFLATVLYNDNMTKASGIV